MSKKTWPTTEELMAWYLFRWSDENVADSPERFLEALREFKNTPASQVHEELYEEYAEFKNQFEAP